MPGVAQLGRTSRELRDKAAGSFYLRGEVADGKREAFYHSHQGFSLPPTLEPGPPLVTSRIAPTVQLVSGGHSWIRCMSARGAPVPSFLHELSALEGHHAAWLFSRTQALIAHYFEFFFALAEGNVADVAEQIYVCYEPTTLPSVVVVLNPVAKNAAICTDDYVWRRHGEKLNALSAHAAELMRQGLLFEAIRFSIEQAAVVLGQG